MRCVWRDLAFELFVAESEFNFNTKTHRQAKPFVVEHVDHLLNNAISAFWALFSIKLQLERSFIGTRCRSNRDAIECNDVLQTFVEQQYTDDVVVVVMNPFANEVGAFKLEKVAVVWTMSWEFSVSMVVTMIVIGSWPCSS